MGYFKSFTSKGLLIMVFLKRKNLIIVFVSFIFIIVFMCIISLSTSKDIKNIEKNIYRLEYDNGKFLIYNQSEFYYLVKEAQTLERIRKENEWKMLLLKNRNR